MQDERSMCLFLTRYISPLKLLREQSCQQIALATLGTRYFPNFSEGEFYVNEYE